MCLPVCMSKGFRIYSIWVALLGCRVGTRIQFCRSSLWKAGTVQFLILPTRLLSILSCLLAVLVSSGNCLFIAIAFFFFCTELLKNSLLNTCLICYKGNTRFLGILIQWGLQQAHRVSQKPAVHLFRILCSEFKQHWLLKLAIMEFPWFFNQGKLESSKIQGSHSPLWHSPLSDTPVHRLS